MRVSVGVPPRLRVQGGKVAVEPSARSFVRCGVLLVAGSVREELEGGNLFHLFHPVRDSEGRASGATVEGGRSFLRTVARMGDRSRLVPIILTSDQVRLPAELKHISKRRKRN